MILATADAYRIPDIVVIIKEIKYTDMDAGALFRDTSGTIQYNSYFWNLRFNVSRTIGYLHGTIHRRALDKFDDAIHPGSVMHLQKVPHEFIIIHLNVSWCIF